MPKKQQDNIAIITLDSLRWDTCQLAETPVIQKYFKEYGISWVRAHPHGTYTLPSHVALFQSGKIPFSDDEDAPDIFKRNSESRLFRMGGFGHKFKSYYKVPHSHNLVKGFEKLGYRTIGIGGVSWFNAKKATTNIWHDYFQEFYWTPRYREYYMHSLDYQIRDSRRILKGNKKPLFFFVNISHTHPPFRNDYTFDGQIKALEYIDARIERLFDILPRPVTVMLWSDHGTVLHDEGPIGHAYFHPKVMEIPIAVWRMDK